MSGDRLRRAETIFTEALALPLDAREAFIAEACAGEPSLRQEIDGLLAAHESHGGALDVPALEGAARELAGELLTLRPGERVGPYEIVKLIGAGGMGEVYEAHDDRLQRKVAVKVLPAWSAADPHRAWRFEQEARAAAALKHANVVAVFDVGRHGETPFIVSELLEGENLRQRMQRQPPNARQASQVVAQVARGLAAAHAAGVVHRDLKPENVFLTREGQVKILDFGLAKLKPRNPLLGHAEATAGASVAGQLLGTVGYMAPEQVRGENVDGRTDLFALGTMLYEALAARPPFGRGSAIETMNAILTADPAPLQDVSPDVPAALARITHRCLEKRPEDRFQSAADPAFALEAASVGSGVAGSEVTRSEASTAPTAARRLGGAGRLALAGVAALGVAGALLGGYWLGAGAAPAPSAPLLRLSLMPPPGSAWGAVPAVSPDGRRLAFVAVKDQVAQLYLQSIDERTASAVPGTQGAMNPFWSPDGSRIGLLAAPPGVLASQELRVVSLDGAVSSPLWSGLSRGVTFTRDGALIIGSGRQGLLRVGPTGGPVEPVSTLARQRLEYGQRWPSVLGDGRHLLYFSWASSEAHRGVYVGRLDVLPEAQKPRLVLRGDSNAVFVAGDAHAPDVLVFERDGTLYAQRFDAQAMALSATPVALEREVGRLTPDHPAQFSVSPDVLVVGPDVPFTARMTMVGRDGRVERAVGDIGMGWPRISPDGRQVLHGKLNVRSGDMDLWILDLERDLNSRVTTRPGFSGWPVWSPDGRQIAYRYEQYATAQLVVRSLDAAMGPSACSTIGTRCGPPTGRPTGSGSWPSVHRRHRRPTPFRSSQGGRGPGSTCGWCRSRAASRFR